MSSKEMLPLDYDKKPSEIRPQENNWVSQDMRGRHEKMGNPKIKIGIKCHSVMKKQYNGI